MPNTHHSSTSEFAAKRLASLGLSLSLVAMVGYAVAGVHLDLFATILISAFAAAAALRALFPASRLMRIAFINLMAVYTAVFSLFSDEVFKGVSSQILSLGFTIPIAMFLVGCWWRRQLINADMDATVLRSDRVLGRFLWLLPVMIVGVAALAQSHLRHPMFAIETSYLGAMGLIGLIVLAVSRDVAVFLVEIGMLFDEFFQRITQLLVPAFAFLTFYSLIIVIFAAIFTIVSRGSTHMHFRVGEVLRPLTFPEALHFSTVTLSTVGYGDIVPISSLSRSLAAVEVVIGIMLLLFGVSEILEYTKQRRANRPHGRDT